MLTAILVIIIIIFAFANEGLIKDRNDIHWENIKLNYENLRLRSKHEYLTGKEDEQILVLDIDILKELASTIIPLQACPMGRAECMKNMLAVSKNTDQRLATCACCTIDYLLSQYEKQINNSNSPLKGLHKQKAIS
jgi:hypothetical protein